MYCEEKTDRLKAMLLDMLSWFHGFCSENGLRYYVIGGTMLGAARHGGFIPWDDDIDIGMPRKDYIRLEKLMQEPVHERYVLETPETGNWDYFYPMCKLYDTHTSLVENTRCRIRRGIYLDIFPIDGAGDTVKTALHRLRRVKRRKQLLLTLTGGIRKGRNPYKNAAVLLMRIIPGWRPLAKRLLTSIGNICTENALEESAWAGNLVGNWMEREVMPSCFFGEPKEYLFEDRVVFGVADYDGYLTALYGQWRELPPLEKRKSHHDFLEMDLERSWL